ncbi:MAG: nickel/cobalt transporter (NiCoT) family protein [Aliidongia sp.]|nr:nickel/cobalt transporter (NiCoT) family protein [Aliidongia sp.]
MTVIETGKARMPAPGRFEIRRRIAHLYALLIAFNVVVWAIALLTFRTYPILLGTGLLAYTFGLRHAVDADHIAAIDNVTRKLMQAGKRPITVGLYFSLGHSSVVFLASTAIAVTASALETRFRAFKEIGGLIGTAVSAGFLLAIAAANLLILVGVYRSFQRVRQGGRFIEEDLDILLANRGLLGRLFRPIFKLVSKSWHMYPLGFLFGLGFDTATEIGVLGMSAAGATQGLPIWSILIFPALFTAAMTLIDTTDGILMLGAYGWAFVKPIRKLYYNMTITFVSAVIAAVVGGIEALGIVGDRLGLDQGFWGVIAALNENFGVLGYLIIALFGASWIVSVLVYRLKGYDRIEVTDA